jgi:hypothetical protein
MKRNRFIEWLFNYKYIANKNTKEIHKLSSISTRCRLSMMRNSAYYTTKKAYKLIKDAGYNGCRYCFKSEDNG